MNPRVTLLLAALVAALGAFTWYYETRGAAAREQAALRRVFPGIEAGDIVSLSLRAEDGAAVRIVRGARSWRLMEPLAAEADSASLDGMAEALAGLSAERILSPGDPEVPLEALSSYGLDAEPRLRFQTKGGSYELRIGDAAPAGRNTYVTDGAAARVYVVPTYGLNAFRRNLDELRERRILDFDRAAVVWIRAGWPGGQVEIARDEQDPEEWRLVQPREAEAAPGAIAELIEVFWELRAEAFVDSPPPAAAMGFDSPAFEVAFRLASGDENFGLAVGGAAGSGRRYARSAEGRHFEIADYVLDDLPREVAAYLPSDAPATEAPGELPESPAPDAPGAADPG